MHNGRTRISKRKLADSEVIRASGWAENPERALRERYRVYLQSVENSSGALSFKKWKESNNA